MSYLEQYPTTNADAAVETSDIGLASEVYINTSAQLVAEEVFTT